MTRWEELGMTPEEYVRSRWGEVAIGEITGCLYMMRDGLYQSGPRRGKGKAATIVTAPCSGYPHPPFIR